MQLANSDRARVCLHLDLHPFRFLHVFTFPVSPTFGGGDGWLPSEEIVHEVRQGLSRGRYQVQTSSLWSGLVLGRCPFGGLPKLLLHGLCLKPKRGKSRLASPLVFLGNLETLVV